MKIIKKDKPKENLEELFGRKKPAPPPEPVGINREWDKYYNILEDMRKSGVPTYLAGMYFSEGQALPDELIANVFSSWLQNYDELSKLLHWDR